MSPADLINGTFELLASIMVLNHCRVLLKDRAVAGVSVASTAFFTLWGVWNIYYYPLLGQVYSLIGGIFVVMANSIYVVLLFEFSGGLRKTKRALLSAICRIRGHRDGATVDYGHSIKHYCARCHHEIGGIACLYPSWTDADLDMIGQYNNGRAQ